MSDQINIANTRKLYLESELTELNKFFDWINSMDIPENSKEEMREWVRFRVNIVSKALSELEVLS